MAIVGVIPAANRYMGHADHTAPGRYRHQLQAQYAEDAARLDHFLAGADWRARAANRITD